MKKKLLSVLLATTMLATCLAGCGGSSDSAASGSAASGSGSSGSSDGEVITLRVADWEGEAINVAMQDAFDNVFSKEHPNIKVEIVPVPHDDYGQGIKAMLSAGEAPDVFQSGYDGGKSDFEQGLLYDWTEKVAAEPEFMEGFYGGTLSGWQTADGKTYGFPGLVNVYGVFYNKDILDAAGIAYPTADWTWDDLYTMAQKVADPANNKYGLYGDPEMLSSAFAIANQSVSEGGAHYVDKMIGTTKVTTDETFIKTAEKVRGYIMDGTVVPRTYETTNMLSEFEAGNMAFLLYGQWEMDNLVRNCPDLNWGYAPTPKGSVVPTTTYDTVGWVAPADTKYPEECWELIKFMSTTMYGTVLKATPIAPCAYIDCADTFYDAITEQGHADAAEAVKTMMNVEEKTATRFAAAWGDDVAEVWDIDWNNFMDGNATADVVPGITEAANAVIANAN